MINILFIILIFVAAASGAQVDAGTATDPKSKNFIHNSSESQIGQFNVSSGTVRGKLLFDTDEDSHLQLLDNDLILNLDSVLRQTWTTN